MTTVKKAKSRDHIRMMIQVGMPQENIRRFIGAMMKWCLAPKHWNAKSVTLVNPIKNPPKEIVCPEAKERVQTIAEGFADRSLKRMKSTDPDEIALNIELKRAVRFGRGLSSEKASSRVRKKYLNNAMRRFYLEAKRSKSTTELIRGVRIFKASVTCQYIDERNK